MQVNLQLPDASRYSSCSNSPPGQLPVPGSKMFVRGAIRSMGYTLLWHEYETFANRIFASSPALLLDDVGAIDFVSHSYRVLPCGPCPTEHPLAMRGSLILFA